MRQDGFSGRYIIKLSSSIIIAGFNAIIQLLLPRVLSVDSYGLYSYNLNVFTSTVVLANLSASNAMVAKFSQRNEEKGIVCFYLRFFLVISILLNISVIMLYIAVGDIRTYFKGQTLFLILLGLNAAILNKLLSDVISMYDALAISRFPAFMQIGLKIMLCICICVGYFLGTLNLYIFYFFQTGITLLIAGLMLSALFREHKRRYADKYTSLNKKYGKEFFRFCKPLVLSSCWSQLMIIVMNSVLMKYAGESEQAMYGVALQINIVIGYVFSPYAELLKREFAVIVNDMEKIRSKLLLAMRHMFWLSAYFSVFILVCADWIIPFLFGIEYSGAISVTRFIMVYTIYQAWGQVGGSFLLATEQTKKQALFTSISQTFVVLGVIIFQIPNKLFPNGLGADGIGLNYMVSNFFSTIMVIAFCAYYSKIKYKETLAIQLKTLFCCVVAAVLSRWLVVFIIGDRLENFEIAIKIFFTGILYTSLIGGVIYKFPDTIGITKEMLLNAINKKKRGLQ